MNETLEILSKVNSFYNNAFVNLITVTAILVAFVGVIIPLLIAYYQNRKIKLEKEELKNYLDTVIKEAQDSSKTYLDNVVKEEQNKINNEIARMQHKVDGKILHVQGLVFSMQKLMDKALYDFTRAGISYIKGNEEGNLQIIIKNIHELILPKCVKSMFESDKELVSTIEEFLTALKNFNDNKRYTLAIDLLDKEYRVALQRDIASNNNK